jgi:hypothetical protein
MEILYVVVAVVILVAVVFAAFEYRVRQPDVLVLFESKGKIGLRAGAIYPRHFSLPNMLRSMRFLQRTL